MTAAVTEGDGPRRDTGHGHRVKAMTLTKDAIDHVKKGIAFDNKR